MTRGFTLIEVLVSVALGVLLIIAAYDLLSDVSRSSFRTRGKLTAISRARTVQDQLRYYVQNAGLGVPSGTQTVLQAEKDHLSLNLNAEYFSYATAEYFLPANIPSDVVVQSVTDTQTGSAVAILSFSGEQISSTPVLQAYDKNTSKLTLFNSSSLWIAKGNYIGKPYKTHTFTISNNRLMLTAGTQVTTIADGLESFDVAFLYDPPWIDSNGNGSIDPGEDEGAIWCYDASQDQPSTYDPGGMQRILDTDLSGDITYSDDQNSDSLIEGTAFSGAVDTDGNGKLNGIPFDQASVVRIWILVKSEKLIGAGGTTKYLVGSRILSFNDNVQRIVSYFDVAL
ncbi:prepilin-type N-terminal cleavage/methylation domain-containing protein [bacterium]|nr:prepilin-type N-terminal cleavage/methylation domain-containing protein [bacterium]